MLQRALADVVPGKGGTGAAPAPLAGDPFSVKRQGRNAGYIAAAGAVGAVERLMTPTMAVPSCRSSRGFQNRPILRPHLLLLDRTGLTIFRAGLALNIIGSPVLRNIRY